MSMSMKEACQYPIETKGMRMAYRGTAHGQETPLTSEKEKTMSMKEACQYPIETKGMRIVAG